MIRSLPAANPYDRCRVLPNNHKNNIGMHLSIKIKKPIEDSPVPSGVGMRQETVHYFTEKEEEFTNLIIEIGTKKNVAKVLVFLARTPQATSRTIERGTDMRQPEVSIAMKYLIDQGWIKSRESPSENKGRPIKVYELAKPIPVIMDSIGNEKRNAADNQLTLVRKLQKFHR
jgi:predicted transcriptional regulator